MKVTRANLIAGFGAIAWVMAVILLYYAGHKPFSLDITLNFLNAARDFLLSAIVIAIAGGIGRRLLQPIEANPLTTLALHLGVGLGVLSISVLILGGSIGFNRLLMVIGIIVLGLVFWRDIIAWACSIGYISTIIAASNTVWKLIGGLIALICMLTLSMAIAPPFRFDSLVYHFYLPAYYLEAGRLVFHPRLFFWGMPQLAEMLYTALIAVGSSSTAAVLAWFVGWISILGIFGYAHERLGTSPAWIAVITLLGGSSMVNLLPSGYIEWFSILFGFGLLVMLDFWERTNQRLWLVWAGIFVGLGLGIKYSNGVLFIAAVFVILVSSIRSKQGLSRLIKDLILLCIPAVFVASPWLIKNLLATGNPLYPFIFPSGAIDSHRLNFYQSPGVSTWLDTLLLPLYATIRGFEGGPGYNATIGPLNLALCPLAFIGYRLRPESQRTTIRTATIISIAGIGVWMIASRFSELLIQSRLYFGLFPSLACLAGAGFSAITQIKSSNIRLGRIIGVLVTLVFLLTTYEISREIIDKDSLKFALGLETRENYLGQNLGWYYPAMEAINKLPEDAKVLMLWEPRAFYCLPKCEPDEVLDRWRHDVIRYGDGLAIIQNWKDNGFTHLLFYKHGAEFIKEDSRSTAETSYSQETWRELDQLLSSLGPSQDFGGAYQLYPLDH